MTIRSKAIAAALLLTLSPAIASAQGITNFGPGVGGAPIAGGSDFLPNPGVAGIPAQSPDCGASYAHYLIGQNAHALPLPGNVRVIGPDTIVTFDYRPDRLNLATDNNGTITRAYCG